MKKLAADALVSMLVVSTIAFFVFAPVAITTAIVVVTLRLLGIF